MIDTGPIVDVLSVHVGIVIANNLQDLLFMCWREINGRFVIRMRQARLVRKLVSATESKIAFISQF